MNNAHDIVVINLQSWSPRKWIIWCDFNIPCRKRSSTDGLRCLRVCVNQMSDWARERKRNGLHKKKMFPFIEPYQAHVRVWLMSAWIAIILLLRFERPMKSWSRWEQRYFLRLVFVRFVLIWNGCHPLLLLLCYVFYRFSHTYVQPIGFDGVHPLSVKRRRFDTFQLLLPFNGPIKLFHWHPFDQSDASTN